MTTCPCGTPLPTRPGRGRRAVYCSATCRQRAHRARRALPVELTSRDRWVRRQGKRPVTVDGHPASSTRPATWSSYASARRSTHGDGLGLMMGDGLAVYDLDHVLDGDRLADWAARFVAQIPERVIFVERSMGGDGVHVFVESHAARGWRRDGVEFYPAGRHVAVTGDALHLR